MKERLIINIGSFEGNTGYVIDHDEVEDVVTFLDYSVAEIDADVENVEKLNKLIKQSNTKLEDYEDLEEFLTNNSFDCEVEQIADVLVQKEQLCYDFQEQRFFDLADCETERAYSYHDGSNYKRIWIDNETNVKMTEKRVCIDEWDGNNWTTGGTGLHEYVYKAIEIEGEKVDDTYVVVYISQWQGSHDMAEIMTIEEVEGHLNGLGRDLDEYMEDIKNLE